MSRAVNNATTWSHSVFESDLSSSQKLICLYLRTHMNDYRETAWPSVARIADRCSLSVRSVQNHLKGICKAGYLLNNGYSQSGTIRYSICTPAEFAPPQKTTLPPAEFAPELNKELNNTLSKEFKRPSVGEVKQYCDEKGYRINPDTFVNYYTSNGWRVGRSSMKCWRSACTNWNTREVKNGGGGGNSKTGGANTRRTTLQEDLTDTSWAT